MSDEEVNDKDSMISDIYKQSDFTNFLKDELKTKYPKDYLNKPLHWFEVNKKDFMNELKGNILRYKITEKYYFKEIFFQLNYSKLFHRKKRLKKQ